MKAHSLSASERFDSQLSKSEHTPPLPTWPPPQDFPIIVDASGRTVSYYGDHKWNLNVWAGKPVTLNFGDGPPRKNCPSLSNENANLLRQISAWWLHGPVRARSPEALLRRFEIIRPIFVLCSQNRIKASDLMRFPRAVDLVAGVLAPSSAHYGLTLLHQLWELRDSLGFHLLDTENLKAIGASLSKHEKEQTPYIPPRIWQYQLNRLKACIDDFNDNRREIEACYLFCLDAYARNSGSLAQACRRETKSGHRPFGGHRRAGESTDGRLFHGPFHLTARRFGIDGLLERWLLQPGESLEKSGRGIHSLSTYFTLIGFVGTAYLANFSLMRIEEAWSLRSDCLTVERDDLGDDIHILQGVTTKTVEDDDARWITAPTSHAAVEAMACVAKLRMLAADANPDVPVTDDDLRAPFLTLRPYEPWGGRAGDMNLPIAIRQTSQSYRNFIERFPQLFDSQIMKITSADLEIARLVTPSLDPELFEVGKVWPIAWHQLRRTGAVNMTASGIVGDSSLQYQLKHASRAMSRYYGQGYYHLNFPLNDSAKAEYIRTMYEMVAIEFSQLSLPRFVSPHGNPRKSQILSLLTESNSKQLSAAAKSGKIAYRETLLGGCTNPNPCAYGGIDNITRCGGGDGSPPCADAIFDKEKIPTIGSLGKVIESRLAAAPENSPLQESLQAQKRAIENALYALKSI